MSEISVKLKDGRTATFDSSTYNEQKRDFLRQNAAVWSEAHEKAILKAQLKTDVEQYIPKPSRTLAALGRQASRPQRALFAGVRAAQEGKPILPEVVKGAKLETEPTYYDIIASAQGKKKEDLNFLEKTAGFAGEILFDPLNFIPSKAITKPVGKAAELISKAPGVKQVIEAVKAPAVRAEVKGAAQKAALIERGKQAEATVKGVSETLAPSAPVRALPTVERKGAREAAAMVADPETTILLGLKKKMSEASKKVEEIKGAYPEPPRRFEGDELVSPKIERTPEYKKMVAEGRVIKEVPPVPKNIIDSGEITNMSTEDLIKYKQNTDISDRELEDLLFGKEGGAKYRKLLKQENSIDVEKADRASTARQAMEDKLTKAQQDRLYGIGEEEYSSPEILDEIIKNRKNIDAWSGTKTIDPMVAREMAQRIAKVEPNMAWSEMSIDQKLAYDQLAHLYKVANENKWDTKELTYMIYEEYGKRFNNWNDAAEMTRQLVNKLKSTKRIGESQKAASVTQALKTEPAKIGYEFAPGDIDILLGERARGSISKATFQNKARELIKKIGFTDEQRKAMEAGADFQYNSRVWSQLTDDEYAEITKNLSEFQKTGDTNSYIKALSQLDSTQAAKNWKKVTQSGADIPVTEATRSTLIKRLNAAGFDNRTIKETMRDMYGAESVGALTEKEAQMLDYFLKTSRVKNGKRIYDDIGHVATAEFVKPLNLRAGQWNDTITKTMFGTPELVMRQFGAGHVFDAYKKGYNAMRTQAGSLFDELAAIQQSVRANPDAGGELFRALNASPEELFPELAPQLKAAIAQIKKVDSPVLPDELKQIVTEVREAQIASLKTPEMQAAARRIIEIYDELADAQKLPWKARIVNYVTNVTRDSAVKDFITGGYFNVVGGKLVAADTIKLEGKTLAKGAEITDDVLKSLRSSPDIPIELKRMLHYIDPKELRSQFLKKRKGSEYVVEDVWTALNAYIPTTLRNIHLNEPYKMARDIVNSEATKESFLADYLYWFNQSIRGNKMVWPKAGYTMSKAGAFARASNALANNTFLAALGLAPDSGLKNLTQGMNTIAELGTKWAVTGYRQLMTKEGYAALEASGVVKQFQLKQLRELGAESKIKGAAGQAYEKFGDVAMLPFQGAEFINRGSTYLGARAKWLAEHPGDLRGADKYGNEMVDKLQFNYTEVATPLMLQSPTTRAAFQFMTYPVKQSELVLSWIKNKEFDKLDRYLKLQYQMAKLGNLTDTDFTNFSAAGMLPVSSDLYEGGIKYQWSPLPQTIISTVGLLTGNSVEENRQNLKNMIPMAIPGGRYGKKVLDVTTTAIQSKAARERGEIPPGVAREYQSFGEFKSPLAERAPEEKKRDRPAVGAYVRKLAGLPQASLIEEFAKNRKEYFAGQDKKDIRDMNTKVARFMNKEKKTPKEYEALVKEGNKIGYPVEEVVRYDMAHPAGGRRKASPLDNYLKSRVRDKHEREVAMFLEYQIRGDNAKAKEYWQTNRLTVTEDDIKNRMKALWSISTKRKTAYDEYVALVNKYPQYALTQEERMSALTGIR